MERVFPVQDILLYIGKSPTKQIPFPLGVKRKYRSYLINGKQLNYLILVFSTIWVVEVLEIANILSAVSSRIPPPSLKLSLIPLVYLT